MAKEKVVLKDELFNNAMNKNIYNDLEKILKLSNEKI